MKARTTMIIGASMTIVFVLSMFAAASVGLSFASSPSLVIQRMIFQGFPGYSTSDYATNANMYQVHYDGGMKVPIIHSINPSVKCWLYRNIRVVYGSSSEYSTFKNNGWLLKDVYGAYIHEPGYSSNYIVDPGNPGYQQWVANWLKTYVTEYGFDGVSLDSLLPTSEYLYQCNSSNVINPRTGKAWTDQQLNQAMIQLVNTIRQVVGKPVIGNAIFNGSHFYRSDYQADYIALLQDSSIDGIWSEGWESSLDSPPQWYTESMWTQSINFAVWLQNNFLSSSTTKYFFPVAQYAAQGSGATKYLPAGCTPDQYVLFNFASLLLAAGLNGVTVINFGYYDSTLTQNLFKISLGNPLGNYYMIAGTHVYARDFTSLKVLVNPTASAYTVQLSGSYQDALTGQTVASSLTISPHTGRILKSGQPAQDPPPNGPLFSDSFESGGFGSWDGTSVTSGESMSVSSTIARDGTHSALFSADGAQASGNAYAYENLPSETNLYERGYIMPASFSQTGSYSRYYFAAFAASGQTVAMAGILNSGTTTTWRLVAKVGTTWTIVDSSTKVSLNQWHSFELQWAEGVTNGYAKLYIDNTLIASISQANTSAMGAVNSVQVGIVLSGNANTSFYLDYVQTSNISLGPLPTP